VHADDLGSGYGKQAERIAFAEILLRREREAREIGEGAQIVRVRADRRAFLPVLRHTVVGVTN